MITSFDFPLLQYEELVSGEQLRDARSENDTKQNSGRCNTAKNAHCQMKCAIQNKKEGLDCCMKDMMKVKS